MELTLTAILLLTATGLAAGVINTLAGGGSNLTVPALMVLGLPADVANGTNRVGVMLQCMVGVAGFDRHKSLDRPAVTPILLPTLGGGILGALAAATMPVDYLKPVLLLTILGMSAVILIKPDFIAPPPGTPTKLPTESPRAWLGLFAAGIYGGFVQAGVGFILLAALSGGLRYDLVRANALKMVCSLAFTALALLVFIAFGQVQWVPGLILAAGTMTGAHIAVKIAVRTSQTSIKWFLFVMTVFAVTAGFLF